jgi:hypothetical protein
MYRSGLMTALVIIAGLFAPPVRAQDTPPPEGGVISPAGAMIFYQAHGQPSACGPNCSDWIAAEGSVEWDTYKRLLAFLARHGDRKLPVVVNVWGTGDLNVAVTLGKIIRERGLDVSAGVTTVADCAKTPDAACFALKRSGNPLDARIDATFVTCDVVCVLILAGGVHRTLPAGAVVAIGPRKIRDRLAPNVSEERQQGLEARYDDQYRLYLKEMGVSAEIVDMIDRSTDTGRVTQLTSKDWPRLGLVTAPAP